ncbi:hypothetical protein XENTR_v10002896 [Xenopus tropicalis]|uniref:Leucine rich repeat containing 70 n=1 Tax=Xenopus tropicalis TaxID=8364 RepID=A0A6I8S1J6_XENTR|nr:leucine-rich repeat-containing protein 70 [Xenopus tropicalis]KAE8636224.1 hypothetical protein XENTR_v10002896 [Xenopus tropicalis]|eukprot:XP_017946290.1 PREDICTED: leucine-rich repeat-containing protein 70 [Xenopus tropicalis]
MTSIFKGVRGIGSKSSACLQVFLRGYILLLHLQNHTHCCPTACHVCTGRQVNCRGSGLSQVPRSFPKTTTLIYLSGNNISHISADDFTDLQKLAVLYLDNASVSFIQPRAFGQLKKLYYLYLNDNFIQLLDPGALDGLSNLNYLYLQSNQMAILPRGLFRYLKALRYLMLNRNQLGELIGDVFAGMTSLSTLNLANNNISRISESAFRYLENLEHLYLDENHLTQVPSLALRHLKNLKRLSLSNNPLGSIHNFAFRGLDSLQYLFLENANIDAIMEYSFCGLNNVKQLILSRNKLNTLEGKMFNYLNHLMYLQLDKNSIAAIYDNTFEELVSLKVLNLAFNNLTFLQPKVLQPLISLTHFQATNNPWDCGCPLLEIRNFLLSSSFSFSIHCQNPPQLQGRPLHNLKRSEFDNCPTKNPLFQTSQDAEFSTAAMLFGYMKSAAHNPFFDISMPTDFPYDELSTDGVSGTTTILPSLTLNTPLMSAPVNLTLEGKNLIPTDIAVNVSLIPSTICPQQLNSLTQSFQILLSFFILLCAVIIFLIFTIIRLKKKHVPPENHADSALEYYSCYHSGRYQLTDPVSIVPQSPDIDILRPLKSSTTDHQTQVILFEHSAL